MLSAKEGMVEFLAVGMRGKLADGSDARFCGAVMGEARYATKQGPAKTVTLVGMFDLPENKSDGGH
jgi:predicted RecA/RadA family phage recombinase